MDGTKQNILKLKRVSICKVVNVTDVLKNSFQLPVAERCHSCHVASGYMCLYRVFGQVVILFINT